MRPLLAACRIKIDRGSIMERRKSANAGSPKRNQVFLADSGASSRITLIILADKVANEMNSNNGDLLSDTASKTILGFFDRISAKISGRSHLILNRLAFAPILQNGKYAMFDQADQIKVWAYISLYSSKSVITRLFKPAVIIRMKGFDTLRLVLTKIDPFKQNPLDIIDEQHVITLNPIENRSMDLKTYIVEKARFSEIKNPHSGFKIFLEYKPEGSLKKIIKIRKYFFCEILPEKPLRMLETKIEYKNGSWRKQQGPLDGE
jgi:hypothetical protein